MYIYGYSMNGKMGEKKSRWEAKISPGGVYGKVIYVYAGLMGMGGWVKKGGAQREWGGVGAGRVTRCGLRMTYIF